MYSRSKKKPHFDDEVIDSDDDNLSVEDDDFSSDALHSETEEQLLEKYNIKDMKSSQSFKNPADVLLSNPKYRGKKTDVNRLELPNISDLSESSQDASDYYSEMEEEETEEEAENIFEAFKSMKTEAMQAGNKPAFISKQSGDTEKAMHMKNQLIFLDDLFSLRIMLQKPFMKTPCGNESVLQHVTELIALLLDMIDGSEQERELSDASGLWECIKNLTSRNEASLLDAYDTWWSKSHLSSRGKDGKSLNVLSKGFSASIEHAMKSFKFSPETSLYDEDLAFYQQFLKDIIDAKLSSSKNASTAILSMPDSKTKKTKKTNQVSKGRLLSYEVHPKLENFMAPQPLRSGWNEEKINQLFNSLPTVSF